MPIWRISLSPITGAAVVLGTGTAEPVHYPRYEVEFPSIGESAQGRSRAKGLKFPVENLRQEVRESIR